MIIDKDMVIADVIDKDMMSANVFLKHGLHCVG